MKKSLIFPLNINFMQTNIKQIKDIAKKDKMPGNDIKQVKDIANKYKMTRDERRELGDFIEKEKKKGRGGTQNNKGDYTYAELDEKAQEFLKLKRDRLK